MLHLEGRWVVENDPASESQRINANEHIVRASPANRRMILYECARICWSKCGRDSKDVAEPITKDTVLHRHKFTHDIVIGELGRGGDADEYHAADEGWDILSRGADNAPDGAADCSANEDVATTEDI